MTKQEEYELLVKMIDDTQKQIARESKDKIQLIAELEQLQKDLTLLRLLNYPHRRRTTKEKGVTL